MKKVILFILLLLFQGREKSTCLGSEYWAITKKPIQLLGNEDLLVGEGIVMKHISQAYIPAENTAIKHSMSSSFQESIFYRVLKQTE